MTMQDILGWMAYDKTNDSDWLKNYNERREIEKSEQMDVETRSNLIKTLLGGAR
jgi:hypothetical protein